MPPKTISPCSLSAASSLAERTSTSSASMHRLGVGPVVVRTGAAWAPASDAATSMMLPPVEFTAGPYCHVERSWRPACQTEDSMATHGSSPPTRTSACSTTT